MAGFQLTLYGRIWVTPEGHNGHVARLGLCQFSDCGVAQVVEAAVEPGPSERTAPCRPPSFRGACGLNLLVFAPREYVV